MSSLHYNNMSPTLQQQHEIALAKKQITSIDPNPPPHHPPPPAPSCFGDGAGRKERGLL